jgi:hypothetical protein
MSGAKLSASRLWSLWDMLQSYLPFYDIGCRLNAMLTRDQLLKGTPSYSTDLGNSGNQEHRELIEAIQKACKQHGLTHTADMAARALARPFPANYREQIPELIHLQDSLKSELDRESIFRIDPLHKQYFERNDLFGSKVAAAFPSCTRDIQRAGSCYALEQEDACVHHLMLVLERGLKALSIQVLGTYQQANWQSVINSITGHLKNMPAGPQRDFYREVNSQFGFLKDAYRNHSEHAHDDIYDMPKALSILNHVKEFMQALEKGGLSE